MIQGYRLAAALLAVSHHIGPPPQRAYDAAATVATRS